ncbi:MAG: CHRD domain-containing protein [Streptosporangiaceae bacterium]|nr:CHRD domain-containing protein [Streptosporangiaceae bacterium]
MKLRNTSWAAAAVLALSAIAGVGLATAAGASPAASHAPSAAQVVSVRLQPMPRGTVSFGRTGAGQLTATVRTFGLTPGSSHNVWLVARDGEASASFGTLTADGVGAAYAVLSGTHASITGRRIPFGSRLVIGLDTTSGQPIAETSSVTWGERSYRLRAVEVGPTGVRFGTPRGRATLAYDPAAHTITVTLSASGLTPGAHAAHIHIGSCQSQGPVQYMLMDFVANSRGQVVHQVRMVTGVTSPIPASNWYLNLHQGNSNNILANGQPTVNFRPLLCSNI